jgi:hypothetical protein
LKSEFKLAPIEALPGEIEGKSSAFGQRWIVSSSGKKPMTLQNRNGSLIGTPIWLRHLVCYD